VVGPLVLGRADGAVRIGLGASSGMGVGVGGVAHALASRKENDRTRARFRDITTPFLPLLTTNVHHPVVGDYEAPAFLSLFPA
jgi:hypothetical protein